MARLDGSEIVYVGHVAVPKIDHDRRSALRDHERRTVAAVNVRVHAAEQRGRRARTSHRCSTPPRVPVAPRASRLAANTGGATTCPTAPAQASTSAPPGSTTPTSY
jgi:hypothetical protein